MEKRQPMIPLIYTVAELEQFRTAVEAMPIGLDEIRRMASGEAPLVGERPGHELMLELGWRIVYSVEEHPRKDGQGGVWLRHMSMSQARPGRWPNLYALGEIARGLGFPSMEECIVRKDMGSDAIEVIGKYEPAP
jgi:hypothetical protein